ncbi:ArnT family glycosyltransferase [Salinibaculum rarum]|uniref:ArnT family glycosyltransferase n=1 Tax=Salinibaculum rarum TaxID=3058903 RepID=UPI00265DC0E3|nr:glycosyltransferase family 39 protein [Salinibaculum sp. KK48]
MELRSDVVGRAKRQLMSDLRADPYLGYVLAATLLLAGFWFWHRIPNFATWDEHNRVLDPLVAYASVVTDPSLEGLQEGVAWGRAPFGATFYVYALAVAPVIVAAAIGGNLDAIAAIGVPEGTYAHYPVWAETPRWIWTWSLVFVRLTNVVFAVVTVYLVYRLGTELQDRWTGRVAAALLACTFGFLKLAKEGGEDIPATMCLVLALYLLVRYVRDGRQRHFYEASAAGGLAIAFKPTVGLVVPIFGLAHLLEARTDAGPWRRALWRPRLLLVGAGIGAVTIALGFPTALVGEVEPVVNRLFGRTGRTNLAVGPTAPGWWWFLRTYVSAFGWPLLVAAVVGLAASLVGLVRLAPTEGVRAPAPDFDAQVLVVATLLAFLAFFATWHDFRVHHLLPTFPLVMILLADALRRLVARRRTVGRVALAVVLVGSAVYAGVGVGLYASMPRDDATAWLAEDAEENATMETYYHGFVENAIPHGMRVNPIWHGMDDPRVERCPEYIQIGYKELLYLRDIPDDQRGYDVDSRVDERATYVRALLNGEYNYTVAAEFGQRPPNFVPRRAEPGSLRDLIPLGVNPHSDQYGDEQELRANQYVAILERDGSCVESRTPPW